MGRATNKYGLSRDIPAPIKRTVRQECGFGCIFCGNAVYEYEHIIPFNQVREHDPKEIALLCSTHHDEVERGIMAKATVRAQRSAPCRYRWPKRNVRPTSPFQVKLGGALFTNPRTVLRVLGRDLLAIREPEAPEAPIRLSATFYDDQEKECLIIDDNECRLNPFSWDIEARGAAFTIRKEPGDIALRIDLPHDLLVVSRMVMQYRGVVLNAIEREFEVRSRTMQAFRLAGSVHSPDTGIEINRNIHSNGIRVSDARRRIDILGSGGDCSIQGKQPPNTDINVAGHHRSVTVNADAHVTVGGKPTISTLGLALSLPAAMKLSLDDLEILVGVGARHSLLRLR